MVAPLADGLAPSADMAGAVEMCASVGLSGGFKHLWPEASPPFRPLSQLDTGVGNHPRARWTRLRIPCRLGRWLRIVRDRADGGFCRYLRGQSQQYRQHLTPRAP